MSDGAHLDGKESHMQRCQLRKQHRVTRALWRLVMDAKTVKMPMTFKQKQNGRMKGCESQATL